MPIYEYECEDCGHFFEELMLSSSAPATKCPKCESGKVDKKFSTFSASVASHQTTAPMCDTTGHCDTPNLPGCGSGMCGLQ